MENVLWRDTKIVGILDFENVSDKKEPISKDLALIVMNFCSNHTHPEQTDLYLMDHFIKTYQKYTDLPPNIMVLIPDFMLIRCFEDFIWCSEEYIVRNKFHMKNLATKFYKSTHWVLNNRDMMKEHIKM